MSKSKFIIMVLLAFFLWGALSQSCSIPNNIVCGNFYSQGDYIVDRRNSDGWRRGHYLLTIDSSNTFELKEVSYSMGTFYTVCSGYLQRLGHNSYKLKKIKVDYPYGALGNPYFNNNNYRITFKSKDTIILRSGRWKSTLLFIERDRVPTEFDFGKYGYHTN